MSLDCAASVADAPLSYVKEQSGRQIEEARKKIGITQRELVRGDNYDGRLSGNYDGR